MFGLGVAGVAGGVPGGCRGGVWCEGCPGGGTVPAVLRPRGGVGRPEGTKDLPGIKGDGRVVVPNGGKRVAGGGNRGGTDGNGDGVENGWGRNGVG